VGVRLNGLDIEHDPVIGVLRSQVLVDFEYIPQRGPPWIDIQTNWVVVSNHSTSLPFLVRDSGPTQEFEVGAYSSNTNFLVGCSPLATNGSSLNWLLLATNQTVPGTRWNVAVTAINDVEMVANLLIAVTSIADLPLTNPAVLGNNGLTWETGGDAGWFGQDLVTFNGHPVSQSGAIGNLQQSWLQTSVSGPGRLSFWWKISSESCGDLCGDLLEFTVGGSTNRIHGEVDWRRVAVPVPPGLQTLTWRYRKDPDTSQGWDAAWLTEVNFEPGIWLELTGGPTNNTCSLMLHGIPGRNYQVMAATTPTQWPPNWFALQPPVLITNLWTPYVDTTADGTTRLYRFVEQVVWLEPPRVAGNQGVQVQVHNPSQGVIAIGSSSNLIDWPIWVTNSGMQPLTTNTDTTVTNVSRRYYRALLLP
jgi:hypothetical protein